MGTRVASISDCISHQSPRSSVWGCKPAWRPPSPSPECVFSEIRGTYWILCGCQAVKRHQSSCVECGQWCSKPLWLTCLTSLSLWATGVGCFGPYSVTIDRRHQIWVIIFWSPTRCIHLNWLPDMDTNYLLSTVLSLEKENHTRSWLKEALASEEGSES